MRYQFYREHKYVSAALNDVERKIARTDFRDPKEVQEASQAFHDLCSMLQGHAEYENTCLHTLLEEKGSKVHLHAADDHGHQDEALHEIEGLFDLVQRAASADDQVSLGNQLYLTYRKFVADNLAHLHEEETTILPELQRLYTDAELKQVEAKAYCAMTPEDMVEMMRVLFPHMNPSDRAAFLSDIHDVQPEKFSIAWEAISPTLGEVERARLCQEFAM